MNSKKELIVSSIDKLFRIANHIGQIEKKPIMVNDEIVISTKEAHTIQFIGKQEHCNISDVAKHFGVTKSAASQIVAKLVKKLFINKGQSAYSNKEYQLTLTKLGWQAFRAHDAFHGRDLDKFLKLLEAYPLKQIATLSVLLEGIEDFMQETLKKR